MISEAIEFLSSKLIELNLFEKVYSQVELITNSDDKKIPAVYISDGKYKPIDYSANNGTAYIRKSSLITIAESPLDSTIGCETLTILNIPIRIVAYKKKSKLPFDCSYTEDILAETIISFLSNNTKQFKSVIQAQKVELIFNSIDTDSYQVWATETAGLLQQDVNYDIACIGIEVYIRITTNLKCLNTYC